MEEDEVTDQYYRSISTGYLYVLVCIAERIETGEKFAVIKSINLEDYFLMLEEKFKEYFEKV